MPFNVIWSESVKNEDGSVKSISSFIENADNSYRLMIQSGSGDVKCNINLDIDRNSSYLLYGLIEAQKEMIHRGDVKEIIQWLLSVEIGGKPVPFSVSYENGFKMPATFKTCTGTWINPHYSVWCRVD